MKIVMMSDSPTVATGYGRVMKMLAQSFHDSGHEITVVGWGYTGEEHSFPYKIIPCDTARDRYGEDIIANFIRSEQPEILFTLGDPWMTEYLPKLEERSAVTWINYFPLDGYPIPPNWHDWIKNADVPVLFSEFAKNLVSQTLKIDAPMIYHGVDTNVFCPLDKAIVKEEFGITGKFVVGTVARNQPRKNLPALVKAFSDFAKNKDDVMLYMHTQVRDVGWNIDELVERFQLNHKAFTTAEFTALKGVPDDELNKIYNCFDIFVLPTMAEGFGLPIVEAQSCGIPVLVTDYSACSELVVDRQELLKVKDTIILGRNLEQAIVDTADITRKLNFFYHDWKRNNGKKLAYYSKAGRTLAKNFDWSKINKQFNGLLTQIEPQALKRPKRIYPQFIII
jgi:glycosyltransferase involved in cell wall biosynthesis